MSRKRAPERREATAPVSAVARADVGADPVQRLEVAARPVPPECRQCRGFTVLELLFTLALVAVLAALAYSQYSQYVDRARNQTAINEIAALQVEIERFRSRAFTVPESLDDIGRSTMLDPWDRPYRYTRLDGRRSIGAARKDRRLIPLNSDYDLFSAGKDGLFRPQVSQRDSLDDIIRARDGAFIGLGSEL